MKKLLNTLFVTSANRYLSLDGENVVIRSDKEEVGRVPLHNLEAIVTFGYTGASPALMGTCAKRNIGLSFLTPSGKFLARVSGEVQGNVLLRKEQFKTSVNPKKSMLISRNCIAGKVFNSKWIIERAIRDYPLRLDIEKLKEKSLFLSESIKQIRICNDFDRLRGLEGEAAAVYFSVFNDFILQQKDQFYFHGRNKRPPLDNVNAMLSFAYTLLAGMCAAALETVGLDPYVGFFHTDRPGRTSLALDMMEELRAVMADRFVLTLINKRIVNPDGFKKQESGAVWMDDDTRKLFLNAWQQKKTESIKHPFLDEKMEWGMVPHAQAMLLSRYLRGDLDEYPVLIWK